MMGRPSFSRRWCHRTMLINTTHCHWAQRFTQVNPILAWMQQVGCQNSFIKI